MVLSTDVRMINQLRHAVQKLKLKKCQHNNMAHKTFAAVGKISHKVQNKKMDQKNTFLTMHLQPAQKGRP